ncbi:hypothetical protein MF672_019335 [Actinomadura sp. ATCC 31491]|uniref:Uncharacterized protein n=1 Tax=Actinomadura luzonensis TaxID=2805427 RepID=A0ABT0FUE0_9ACTN|nr:hypothetical protein [Actinomadura luzonensis]MCK2215932.1 hypothetical protein [Actinomadura luzonensis]
MPVASGAGASSGTGSSPLVRWNSVTVSPGHSTCTRSGPPASSAASVRVKVTT